MPLRSLVLAGAMAGLAALLQTAPLWLGQPAGFGLAAAACLPLAILAAGGEGRPALLALPVAALLCGLLSPEEAWLFGLTNGPFGVALGLGLGARGGRVRSVLLPAALLFGGMAALTWGVGFAALGPGVTRLALPLALACYALFALLWSALMGRLLRILCRRLLPHMH